MLATAWSLFSCCMLAFAGTTCRAELLCVVGSSRSSVSGQDIHNPIKITTDLGTIASANWLEACQDVLAVLHEDDTLLRENTRTVGHRTTMFSAQCRTPHGRMVTLCTVFADSRGAVLLPQTITCYTTPTSFFGSSSGQHDAGPTPSSSSKRSLSPIMHRA